LNAIRLLESAAHRGINPRDHAEFWDLVGKECRDRASVLRSKTVEAVLAAHEPEKKQ
jgi:hypothetical protein